MTDDYAAKKARDFFSRLPDGVAAEGHVAALIRVVVEDCAREVQNTDWNSIYGDVPTVLAARIRALATPR